MKITYSMFMNDEFYFVSEEDKKVCFDSWDKEIELTADDFGRVFNEAGTYIADIILAK